MLAKFSTEAGAWSAGRGFVALWVVMVAVVGPAPPRHKYTENTPSMYTAAAVPSPSRVHSDHDNSDHENSGHENLGDENSGHGNSDHENSGHDDSDHDDSDHHDGSCSIGTTGQLDAVVP
jgi:hypothetical protein